MTGSPLSVHPLVYLAIPLAFIIGSVPFGILCTRGRGIDIRSMGSKNIGATNVLRSVGKVPALLTLLGDILKGTAAVANVNLIYREYIRIFSKDEFKELEKQGASVQRCLWGSTGTKNPAYSDIKYMTELIATNTVNTVPENTLEAFLDHGVIQETITADADEAQGVIDTLQRLGIDINDVCTKLLEDGVIAFEQSFDSLLNAIEKKTRSM